MGGRALEDHVLEKVGHARLAVALVPRAHEDGQVDRHLGAGRIGEQEHAQAVFQAVLRDSLDRGDLLGAGEERAVLAAAGSPRERATMGKSDEIVGSSEALSMKV